MKCKCRDNKDGKKRFLIFESPRLPCPKCGGELPLAHDDRLPIPSKPKPAKVRRPKMCGECPIYAACGNETIKYNGPTCSMVWEQLSRYMAATGKAA